MATIWNPLYLRLCGDISKQTETEGICIEVLQAIDKPEVIRAWYHAMPGPKDWPEGGNDAIMGHFVRVQPGRLRKAKRREPDESDLPYKVSRWGYAVRC